MVFPVLYSMLLLSIPAYLTNTCHGNKLLDYNVDETLDRRILQEERKGNLGNFQMKKKESFVVTPPFEHNVITLDKNSAKKGDTSWDDSFSQPEINDKDGKTYNYEANGYENYDYDAEYNNNIDYKAPYNLSDEYNSQNNVETLMDVLSKQNLMVEKLVDLYQAEISNNQFDKLIESINNKKYMQFLEFNNGHIARNGTEANDTKTTTEKNKDEKNDKEEKRDKEETKDDEEKKDKEENKEPEEELIDTVIHVDETLVKKKLANDPFVKRILRMARKKKEQYMKKREQELAMKEYFDD